MTNVRILFIIAQHLKIEIVTLESYGLLDFYVSHSILKNKLLLFANVTNILNEDYQELFGYSTRGRGVNLGFNLKL